MEASETHILTGDEFNKIYATKHFVELTTDTEKHRNFKFQSGLNVSSIELNSHTFYQANGIHFIELSCVSSWLNFIPGLQYIRFVTIPNDANICVYANKFKANKLILGERQPIEKFLVLFGIINTESFIWACCNDKLFLALYMIEQGFNINQMQFDDLFFMSIQIFKSNLSVTIVNF
mgnify:FL=1